MSNLKRKVQDIKIDNKDYVMAFDMESCEVFKELSGQSILNSLIKLEQLDDIIVLYFIASTLRDKETEKIIGTDLFNGNFDLFTLVISLVPIVIKIVTIGFPQSEGKKEKN
ncbi:hypothetical protein [Clostridium botulinum]|uniref:hypothetical protein n=1 Tax=Clostridium botulinum TaxID=1491 RepID=UPI0007737FB7|nr:hypothetical protein [Clostridium botulinum]MBY6932254.1 hypothetical protein [Clostridium botulinum]NFG22158.1 hypothetical protein [Clostridium botulinum]NFL39681.1 hypothetical protein [Clostridium botulinum]NFL66519.1 hypothetical protein [Clostridium botulinum]NFN09533.1 hypothetical protein [Clostridium botulinum]